jgi:hypothetical protein
MANSAGAVWTIQQALQAGYQLCTIVMSERDIQ